MTDKELAETEIKSERKYDGEIIRVDQETVRLANGKLAHRDVVHHAAAVAMLVLTDENRMVLEKQWREPAKAVMLEIPAGKLDERDRGNEMHAVQRELNEEVRYQAATIQLLSSFYTSCGFTDEYMYLYLVTDLTPVTTKLPRDAGEFLELGEYTLAEAKELLATGQIQDAKTIMAIQAWELMQK
ncbi:NUDIX hydrolase [Fructilactobacillus ixorae]|uniref:NUDIX hydrolase n=1 Tax=Fructilactobacillus ixorae TaxID=1750535 RepID=A0ABY5C2U1_9LACO|nr:NUDIX hydrolase [Fructilactobacillus ixorae]USS92892.1 NUDIX hydrolase [Fructilactobacillus ixorae]